MTNIIESRDAITREGARLHAQALRDICASRGLPMSSGCALPCEQCKPPIKECECWVADPMQSDSEGGDL